MCEHERGGEEGKGGERDELNARVACEGLFVNFVEFFFFFLSDVVFPSREGYSSFSHKKVREKKGVF